MFSSKVTSRLAGKRVNLFTVLTCSNQQTLLTPQFSRRGTYITAFFPSNTLNPNICSKMERQDSSQNGNQNGQKTAQVAVVMVPLPMQSHLNQLLHLSHLITAYGIPVHFAGSAIHNRQAKLRLHGWDPETSRKIEFYDLPLPSYSSTLPNPNASTRYPAHFLPLFNTAMHLRDPMSQLLQDLSTKFSRIVIIHDILMASVVQDVKLIPNAEAYSFVPISAFNMFMSTWESLSEKPFQLDSDIPTCLPPFVCSVPQEVNDFVSKQFEFQDFQSGTLFNTSRLIEGKYLELLERLPSNASKKNFAVGPFNPLQMKSENEKQRHECLEWLDKQEADSVMYISFGSTTSMTTEEIRELAKGLEQSGQKFIWVLRTADKADVFAGDEGGRPQLPEGYEERMKNRGMIVRDWAPQLEILGHPSTGGFMSHCGWNSCIESISVGVPIAAWPIHSEQPRNAIFMTEALRIGMLVTNWAHEAEQPEPVTSNTIEDVVRRLMTSKEGEKIRKRAAELGAAIRGSVADGVQVRHQIRIQNGMSKLFSKWPPESSCSNSHGAPSITRPSQPAPHLSHLITSDGMPVHHAGSAMHNRQAKLRLHGCDPENTVSAEPLPNQMPRYIFPHISNLSSRHLCVSSIHQQPVFKLARQLSTTFRRIVVVHDALMASVVQDAKLIPNAESYNLYPPDSDLPISIPPVEGCLTPEFPNFADNQFKHLDFQSGRLYNRNRLIEGRYVEILERLPMNANMKHFFSPVEIKGMSEKLRDGSWMPQVATQTRGAFCDVHQRVSTRVETKQPKFIWVHRIADKGDAFAEEDERWPELPEGYEERAKNRGIMRLGTPARNSGLTIHRGFMSHCGWNSCLESIRMGVPIAAWPMHADQARNAFLVMEVLRIGTVVTSDCIKHVVKTSKEGQEMRKTAAELGEAVRKIIC
ncbi:LOW QUALITY PROTEIN: hypothetical protein Cgig2_001487 [Carnegiea gigantea]|uniref:2-hydroxyflavanone C-glucosyltransferase n=1 Tax=Carnegiea gigantea TaxID=171969 RepID=A0A9Q1KS18_9CARY|nr:LOW QUALITY PROTEIN: hypothetical protein Cgig2_001487 [Carnegiea gigantea]